jgi:hypothetical protein
MDYANLREFATVRQLEYIEAVEKHGGLDQASKALGVNTRTISRSLQGLRKRAAVSGWSPEHDLTHKVAPGQVLRGASTLYRRGEDAPVLQWVKSSADDARRHEMMRDFVAELCEDIKGKSPHVKPPTFTTSDLLACYPIGDHHHGMYSDADETGADYDCKISKSVLEGAFDYLISIVPPAHTALLINLGDFFHANDSTNETPGHGNRLDVDTRYGKVMHSGAMALIHCILKLLTKHQKVIVWMMPGNHDPDASFSLAMAISFYFHNEPRVVVDMGTALYKYHRFGKNLIASHHGHGAKGQDLPLIMAADRREDWGATEHRVWHCGHIHHKTVKEHPGCTVETHRTLAASDAWHSGKGYRSKRDLNAIVYHSEHGEIQRTRCDVAMLRNP